MFATPRRLRCRLGGEVHARRKVWRARKLTIQTRNWLYERPSMPRPPYIKVGAEDAISPRGSVFASSTLREQQGNSRGKTPLLANAPLTADAHPNSARSTLFDRGWQQPLDYHKAQPARRVKDAEGTAQPLVLDSARWLGYIPCFSPRLPFCNDKFIYRPSSHHPIHYVPV